MRRQIRRRRAERTPCASRRLVARPSHCTPQARTLRPAEPPASNEPDAESEVIPAPPPVRNVPLREDNREIREIEEEEPIAGGDPLEPCCDDDWCRPRSGRIDFECSRPFGGRLWTRAEYLLWWTRGANLPILATTSPAGTSPENSGVLGQPGTSVLFGDGAAMTAARSGGRFSLGYLICPPAGFGVEANYLFLGSAAARYQADSSTIPILARPYYDLGLNTESALLASHPDFLSGAVSVNATTDFKGAEVLAQDPVPRILPAA